MKNIIIGIVLTMIVISCGENKKVEENNNENSSQNMKISSDRKLIEDVTQYFSTFRPTEITTMVLDKEGFEKNFNPARTMDNIPTLIDFDTYKVGAIVVPETAFDTEIIINDVSIINRKLVIDYSITHLKEERTFTIVPIKLFQYSTQLSIDSVSFVNNNIVETYAK